MPVSDRLQGVPANAEPAENQDQSDDECRQGFYPAVAVRMILIGRSDGNDHSEQHNRRRQDIARELHASGNDGRRVRENAAHDVQRCEKSTGGDADGRDAAAGVRV